jgi:hypothetical protein
MPRSCPGHLLVLVHFKHVMDSCLFLGEEAFMDTAAFVGTATSTGLVCLVLVYITTMAMTTTTGVIAAITLGSMSRAGPDVVKTVVGARVNEVGHQAYRRLRHLLPTPPSAACPRIACPRLISAIFANGLQISV